MALVRDRYDPDDLLSQLARQQAGKDGREWCFRFESYDPAMDNDDFIAYLPEDKRQHADARARLASFISHIRTFDNVFQDSCEEDHRAGGVRLADVKLHIGWLRVAANVVTVRYWGTVVNTEFEVQFQQNGEGRWRRITAPGS